MKISEHLAGCVELCDEDDFKSAKDILQQVPPRSTRGLPLTLDMIDFYCRYGDDIGWDLLTGETGFKFTVDSEVSAFLINLTARE